MKIDKLGEGHYQTRSGLPVVITSLDSGSKVYPVKGYFVINGDRHSRSWTIEGAWAINESSELDLILVDPQSRPLLESETGYKIDLSEASEEERREAQELAFELGWEWTGRGKRVQDYPIAGLFLGNDTYLSFVRGISQTYNEWKSFEITLPDLRAAVAYKNEQEGKDEQPESKQERPVDVRIPYSNDAERKAAIKQAESYGYKEWEENSRRDEQNCIWLDKDGDWLDTELRSSYKTIPLDRSFMEADDADTNVATNFTFSASDYIKTVNEDGTITLTPIDKEYQANYEKALNFLDGTPEVMWSREDLAKILVEFLNSVK